ncbi:MAG: hypothetical protein U0R51_03920 [Solirubrobacterales bacterium]
MSTANARPANAGRLGGEEPLPLPFPSPEFRKLDLRQSTIASAIGLAVGVLVAAAVIIAIAAALL